MIRLKKHNPEYYYGNKKQVIKALEQLLGILNHSSGWHYKTIKKILSDIKNGISATDDNNNILYRKRYSSNNNEIVLSKELVFKLNNYWKRFIK